jgi:hypothetical protein
MVPAPHSGRPSRARSCHATMKVRTSRLQQPWRNPELAHPPRVHLRGLPRRGFAPLSASCFASQFNIANPATGCMKCIEVDDEKKL